MLLIQPYAPHVAEELWPRLGHERLWEQPWPVADEALPRARDVRAVVQVNGKVRDRFEVPAGAARGGAGRAREGVAAREGTPGRQADPQDDRRAREARQPRRRLTEPRPATEVYDRRTFGTAARQPRDTFRFRLLGGEDERRPRGRAGDHVRWARPLRFAGREHGDRTEPEGGYWRGTRIRLRRRTIVRMRSWSDARLVRSARDGSADAAGELFRGTGLGPGVPPTRSRAGARWPTTSLQDAFERAFAALARFDERRPFAPWLHRIVVNRALDLLRSERRLVGARRRRASRPTGTIATRRPRAARGCRGAAVAAPGRGRAPLRRRLGAR